jgi:AcrR family transcriptional regulator
MNKSHSTAAAPGADPPASARERIDRTAYELFCRHGIRAVGVDTIVARSGVAKKTLYRHYPSKNELALAFLRRRDEIWIRAWLQRRIEGRAGTPGEKLLAIFDAFDEWFHGPHFEGCPFLKAILEHDDRQHPVRKAALHHVAAVRALIVELAEAAGVRDADTFARQWQLLMMGSIVAAHAGNARAARQAKELGKLLLASNGVGRKHRA